MCAAPPGLSRLAAAFFAPSSQGIRLRTLHWLGHIVLPACAPLTASARPKLARARSHEPRRLFFLHQKPSGFGILLRFPSLVMSNIKLTSHILMTFMEIRGFEPLTLGLQSRCSSQLS